MRKNWPRPGWRSGRGRLPAGWTVMSGSITAIRPSCHGAMCRANDCACGEPPTTGSTTPSGDRSSSSPAITAGLGIPCSRTLCRNCLRAFPGSRRRNNWPTILACIASFWVFDREGATTVLLDALWATTHRRHHLPQERLLEVWPEGEFADTDVTMPDGVHLTMKLAQREPGWARP